MSSLTTLASLFVACAGLLGCAGPGQPVVGTSRGQVEAWAGARGFHAETLAAGPFRLFSLLRRPQPAATLIVYIEGDGAPWPSPYRPPRDPTPETPFALLLAEQDGAPAVAYLARPCQYPEVRGQPACDSRHWVDGRYSETVLAAMDTALDQLKRRSGAQGLGLVGYSGGGVVATLLAGRRRDVYELITVAAPLALSEWTTGMALSPLAASLDPSAQASLPETVAATHFAGEQDDVVPPAVIERFIALHGGRMVAVAGFGHDCCWWRDWPDLLAWARKREAGR